MGSLKTVPNQKVIRIIKAKSDKDNKYGIVNKDSMYNAMARLTYNEFKLYMYFTTNQDGFIFALSTEEASELLNANKRKLQEAVNGLISKGYLVGKGEGSNQYAFREHILSPVSF